MRRTVVGVAAAALALVGCGSGAEGGGGTAANGKTELTWFMWAGSDAEVKAWTTVAGMVNKKHPDITVTFTSLGYPDYWTKIAAQASGGQLPCLVGMQSLRVPGLGKLMRPLTAEDLSKNGVDINEFDPAIIEGLQLEGKQVALPYDLGPYMIFYNKDMFAKAGVPEPKAGWSADDFISSAKRLTGDGKYGFGAFPFVDGVQPFATSIFGVQAVDEQGQLKLTDAQYVKAVQWYVDLVQKEKVAPEVPATNDPGWPVNQFLAGNIGMIIDGPWDLINVKTQAKFELGVVQVPTGPEGKGTVSAGSGFAVAANCETPDEAVQALSVITGPEALQYLGEQGRALPARPAQQAAWFANTVPGAKEALEAAAETAQPYRSNVKWNQASQLFQQYGTESVNGQQPVQTWLENVQQQAG
jgi:multiple sugar transport system substrate-binding protein